MIPLLNNPVFIKLQEHYSDIYQTKMTDLFKSDPLRAEKFSIWSNDIFLDYSKNIINNDTIKLLLDLCREAGLANAIEDLFTGKKLNFTENRAVLHTALRNVRNSPVLIEGIDIMHEINRVKNKMKEFAGSVHSGKFQGSTGKRIDTIVNIGIGGSDLGPSMVCDALKFYSNNGMKIHFISNIDSAHIVETLKNINFEKTLFIIASKTFTTQETITNAITAKNWLLQKNGNNQNSIKNHFVAISTNKEAVINFGIDPENIFEFWDWVGGRYSLWSAIGLSIILFLGYDNFESLLEGANEMDLHFRNTPLEANIPVILAILGIWYYNFFNSTSYAVIPYEQYLDKFPIFLQQLDMESNGKYIMKNGERVNYNTGQVIFGTSGTNSQHSYFQLIHQGTQLIPVDFIGFINQLNDIGEHHDILISNFLAQTEALMKGRTEDEVKEELNNIGFVEKNEIPITAHKVFEGNKPTNSILINKLTPKNLGSIIAMYEHKVFVQGIIWNINSFDQWGVELGKKLAKQILVEINMEEEITSHDSSTNYLINLYKKGKNK